MYEYALAVHDQKITARGDREKTATSVEIEGPVRQSIEIVPHLDVSIQAVDPASTHGGGPTETPMSADTEAALTLLSLRYSGHVREYIHDDTHHTTSLHPFNSKSVAKADPPKLLEADAVSKTEAHELTAGKAVQKSASPQGRATKVPDEDDCEQPRGDLLTQINELRPETRPSLVRRSQTLAEPPAAVRSARKLRSSIKIPTNSVTPQPSWNLRSSKKPPTGMAKVSPTISSKARQPEYLGSSPVSQKRRQEDIEDNEDDEDVSLRRKTQVVRCVESGDEEEIPLTPVNTSPAGSKEKRAGYSTKAERLLPKTHASLVRRQPTRNLRSFNKPLNSTPKASPAIINEARQSGRSRHSPVSQKRRHGEIEDDEEVPVHKKSRSFRMSESDNEDETPLTPIKNSPAGNKQKRAEQKPQRQLINPPADLPLRAPARTPGIPSDALGMDEYFQKNTQCALGVQLPINATRTQWEWVAYVPRKARNARFDWADEENIRDANRWRQQRLRRRLAQHGLIDDGRKRR
jgi:hypothetical protein